MARFEIVVEGRFQRRRLDSLLFDRFSSMSKAYIRSVVKDGHCEVNGWIANSGTILREGDFVEIRLEEKYGAGMKPEPMDLTILFEDSRLIAVDKPAGVLVHPTNFERNGTILNGLTHYLNRRRPVGEDFKRPHLIHRLDRETSGVLVAAKDAAASAKICDHFRRGLLKKRYFAVASGNMKRESGEIDHPIARDPELRKWIADQEGKESLTRYKVLDARNGRSLLELEPVTGRTNQLRIHLSEIGHPILGDEMYGGEPFERLCLHAAGMEFWHPEGGTKVSLRSQPTFLELAGFDQPLAGLS